jgi:hypothetical protein
VAAVIGLLRYWGEMVPLFGRPSIGGLASVLAGAAAIIAIFLAYKPPRLKSPGQYEKIRRWLAVCALAFILGAISFLLSVAAYFVFQNAFQGLVLDQWVSALLVGLTSAGAGYASYLAGTKMTSIMLSTVLAVFMVSGIFTSMITAEDPYWWMVNFSSLGLGGSPSAYAFNLTMIIGGLVIVGLSDLIAADFERLQTANKVRYAKVKDNAIRLVLAGIGIGLAGVGLFVWDVHVLMHDLAAASMAVLFVGLLAALPFIAPSFSRAFYMFSYLLLAVVAISFVLCWRVGYFNVTAFELVCAAVIFAWLIVFIRNISAEMADRRLQSSIAG